MTVFCYFQCCFFFFSTIKNQPQRIDVFTKYYTTPFPRRDEIFKTFREIKLSCFYLLYKTPPESPDSCRPVNLLAFFFFKNLRKRILFYNGCPHTLSLHNILPSSQFGFCAKHSIIHQVHRLVVAIQTSLECKQYGSCGFLDISQAFDRLLHEGLVFNLRNFLPLPLFLLIGSYLIDRYF